MALNESSAYLKILDTNPALPLILALLMPFDIYSCISNIYTIKLFVNIYIYCK